MQKFRTLLLLVAFLLVGLNSIAKENDIDNDGLSDVIEQKPGTDPANADTDGDGYFDGPDVWVDLGKDGLVIQAGEDLNGNGIYDQGAETNPKDASSHPAYGKIRVVDKNRNYIPDVIEQQAERNAGIAAKMFGDNPAETRKNVLEDAAGSLTDFSEKVDDPSRAFAKAPVHKVIEAVETLSGEDEFADEMEAAIDARENLTPSQKVLGKSMADALVNGKANSVIPMNASRMEMYSRLSDLDKQNLHEQIASSRRVHATDATAISDLKTREAFLAVQEKLKTVRGYKAKVRKDGFNLFVDLNPKVDQQVGAPGNNLRIERETPEKWIVVITGEWVLGQVGTSEHEYIKCYLKRLVEEGDITTEEYLAAMGDLLHPFDQFRLESLKLEEETPESWVFSGECNYGMIPWASTRITIDKRTGLLSQVQTDQGQFGQGKIRNAIGKENLITLLKAEEVGILDQVEMSQFALAIPPAAPVEDVTEGILWQLKERVLSVKFREFINGNEPMQLQAAMGKVAE